MIGNLARSIFGTRNDREIKRIERDYLSAVNALEDRIKGLTDDELAGSTARSRERLDNGAKLDELLVESFALCREAARRRLRMRHFDVQIIGAIALHQGRIAEMKTGEGKTLAATAPLYLNALAGKGAHLVTVNDYLATRDAEWMGQIYSALGMSCGVIKRDMTPAERRAAYQADITYATNNELGFDYLRDNMALAPSDVCQRRFYAIVDEVDSILIDEARTPLIISGRAEESTEKYYKVNAIIPALLKKDDSHTIDEKSKVVSLTEAGIEFAEAALKIDNLYDPLNVDTLHHLHAALKAHLLYKRDVHYVLKDGAAMIVDEFTGRLMPGRRWSDGIHQAVEAKEGLKVENENQTVATITFQNFFRLYEKLAGMTGTAQTEATEFMEIYNLDTVSIPTNQPMIRDDQTDLIFKRDSEKYRAIVEEITERHQSGQPILVGTVSIEKSERISRALKRAGIKHNVLNAKHHEKEAEIIAQAGRYKAVTIATNMAGRGTDIVLGGNPEAMLKSAGIEKDSESFQEELQLARERAAAEREKVLQVGGLMIIGSERHESRRIDNQLRGRAGRQGDKGASRFFISLEDDLIRVFGGEKIQSIMDRVWSDDGEPIEAKMLTKAIENAQRRVEGHNFDMRKHLLEYDDVLNSQRSVIYEQRETLLKGEKIDETIDQMAEQLLDEIIDQTLGEGEKKEPDPIALSDNLKRQFNFAAEPVDDSSIKLPSGERIDLEQSSAETLFDKLNGAIGSVFERARAELGNELAHEVGRFLALRIIDSNWRDHLQMMDHLKEGIGLRGYAQKNPLNEYKREGMDLFTEMIDRVRADIIANFTRAKLKEDNQENQTRSALRDQLESGREREARYSFGTARPTSNAPTSPQRRMGPKIGRNDPCPCGSGLKHKKCCLGK